MRFQQIMTVTKYMCRPRLEPRELVRVTTFIIGLYIKLVYPWGAQSHITTTRKVKLEQTKISVCIILVPLACVLPFKINVIQLIS